MRTLIIATAAVLALAACAEGGPTGGVATYDALKQATEACKAAPLPPVDILTTDVYADGGWAWRN